MGNSETRPGAGVPVDVNQPEDILQKLLDIELNRLDVACRIEKERNIVFPETTVIIHDILKLKEAIEQKKQRTKSLETGNIVDSDASEYYGKLAGRKR